MGYKVELSDYVVDHVTGVTTIHDSLQRMLRWSCGTRRSDPSGYSLAVLTFGSVSGLLLLMVTGGSALGWGLWAATWSVRWGMGWVVGIGVLQDPVVQRFWWFSPFTDIVSFIIWCSGFLCDTVEWRGQRLKISQDGRLELIT
jgi:ceramide glucosyltransferase